MTETIRVLLVDDDEDIGVLAGRYLQNSVMNHYALRWEPNEDLALVAMAQNRFDIYLVDYNLQKMSGIELFLKARASGCKGPVIMVTSMSDPQVDKAALEAGVDDYLHKDCLSSGILERAIRYAVERRRTERVITERQLALSHTLKLSTLGKMTSCIAHEINNPLAIIIGRISMMETLASSNSLSNEEALRYLSGLHETADKMRRIVRTLYGFSRDSAFDPYELGYARKIVQDAAELSGPKLAHVEVALQLADIDPDLQLECKALEISQVLVNLICNGVDAVKDLEERWVRVEVTSDERTVTFAVTDSGHGISEEAYERFLRPFASTKAAGAGMGLGLTIVRDIVEQHMGLLRIDRSSPRTRFVVELPKVRQETQAPEQLSILVVDDEETIVASMIDAFTSRGYRVVSASNAMTAHQILQKQKIDVVLSDLVMPGIDGAALYRNAQRENILPRKFIFMTGHHRPQELLDEFKDVDVYTKPFDIGDLMEKVKTFALSERPRNQLNRKL